MNDLSSIRAALSDPFEVCRRLGLGKGARHNAGGLLVLCPVHGDRNPSCSVTRGSDGTLRFRCFACGASGDVFTLLAAVEGLDVQRDFPQVRDRAAELAGDRVLDPRPLPPPPPPRPYPPLYDLRRLWDASGPVADDQAAADYFADRGLDARALDAAGAVRIIPAGFPVPAWATFRGGMPSALPWTLTGHRAIVRMVDVRGRGRSVRALRIERGAVPPEHDRDIPKRLPPTGFRATGLAMACPRVAALLRTGQWPESRLLIVEGEPDWLTWRVHAAAPALLGIVCGSWTGDLAAAIPDRTTICLGTDHDHAGDRYAAEIAATIGHRCTVLRSAPSPEDWNDLLRDGRLPRDPFRSATPAELRGAA